MTTVIEAIGYMLGGLFALCGVGFVSFIAWIFYLELRMRMRTVPPMQGEPEDDENQSHGSSSA